MSYVAPIRDLRFALDEVAAMTALRATGGFDDLSDDVEGAVLEEAGRLAVDVLAPLNEVGDREGARLENGVVYTATGFKEAYAQYAEGGWQGLSFSTDVGGAGLPRAMALAVSEMVQSANMAFGLCPMLTLGAVEALAQHGTDEQRSLYLPKLVSGEWTGAMALTEPHAGSDVGALKTKAEPVGDGSYKIRGQKIWITYGDHDYTDNVAHLVLARLPGAPEGTKGISLFLVPKYLVNADGSLGSRNDMRCIGLEGKMGIHASPTCVMSYGDDTGALGYLIGEENAGMRMMFTMMNSARVNVGVQGVAIAERAYQRALAFAQDRRQGRTPEINGQGGEAPGRIIDHPDVRRMLLTMKAKIDAGRAMCFATAVAADFAEHAETDEDRAMARGREELLTPIAKAWCTDMGVEIASLGVQVHGGQGFVEEVGAAQHYRDARIAPIYEGTNGIQALDLVGRKLSMDDGAHAQAMIDDIAQTVEALETSSNADLHPIGGRLRAACDALNDATRWMSDPGVALTDRFAGATAYLSLFGDVVGGYFLGVGAVAGQRRLKMQEGDPAFAQSKIDLARFYADTVLSCAPGKVSSIQPGAACVFAIPEALLSA